MPAPEAAVAAALKVFGAVIGSLLALVYMQPRTRREFASRLVFGIGAGTLAAPQVLHYTGWGSSPEHVISAAALAGGASWWVAGAAIRVAQGWKGK